MVFLITVFTFSHLPWFNLIYTNVLAFYVAVQSFFCVWFYYGFLREWQHLFIYNFLQNLKVLIVDGTHDRVYMICSEK